MITTPYSWEKYFNKKKNLERQRFKKDIKKEHPEIIRQLVEKISILIKNRGLREKMGKLSKEIIEDGKLSIKERNKKLLRFYKEALEDYQ